MKKRLNLNKTMITIIILNTTQIGAAAGIVLYDYFNKGGFGTSEKAYGTYFILVIIAAVLLNSFLTVRDVRLMGKHDSEYEMVRSSLEQVEKLNNTLRGQRHDFMNHLQVVYGLMEMGEYSEATDYIEKVFNDIQRVSRILKTSNPAVNALLQAKVLYCEKRNIKIEFSITSRLDNLKIPSWEFCRVIGNIIDNSIYALMQKESERSMEVFIYEDLKNYGFKIRNNGPRIPDGILSRIFQPGFTTKGEAGEGMGLAITKGIIEEHGGSIEVFSSDTETSFVGSIPK